MDCRRVLIVGSNILGNATATKRFTEALGKLPGVAVSCVSISQLDIDSCRLPSSVRRYQLLPTYFVLRKRLLDLHQNSPDFDLIFVITCQPLVALRGLWPKARLVLWFDGLPHHSEGGLYSRILNRAANFIYQSAFRRVQYLLPMSRWAKSRIGEFEFPSVRDVVLAPTRVSRSVWEYKERQLASAGEIVRVLLVGNNANGKGFIDFFRWCVNEGKDLSAFHFTIVSNERNSSLKELILGLPVTLLESITHDNLSVLASIFHSSHVFLLPTKADMLPNVLIEAAAARLPIIASGLGAIDEVVVNGKTGWLVEPLRWDLFFDRLQHFANNPGQFLLSDLASHAENFFDEKMMDDLGSIVFDVLRE